MIYILLSSSIVFGVLSFYFTRYLQSMISIVFIPILIEDLVKFVFSLTCVFSLFLYSKIKNGNSIKKTNYSLLIPFFVLLSVFSFSVVENYYYFVNFPGTVIYYRFFTAFLYHFLSGILFYSFISDFFLYLFKFLKKIEGKKILMNFIKVIIFGLLTSYHFFMNYFLSFNLKIIIFTFSCFNIFFFIYMIKRFIQYFIIKRLSYV